jgi:HAD superfamily (subfamily IIIA) phosphatase, TIGR01668
MFKCFFPDDWVDSTYAIDFEQLHKDGVKGFIFDIDNTLVPHGVPADERCLKLFEQFKEWGISYCLLSNNQSERVSSFAKQIDARYIENAHKPSTKNYFKAMAMMGTTVQDTVFIGDQLFTDVWGAKRAGIRNFLVKPIHPKEEIQIVLKRYLEKIVLYFYKKERGIR